MRLLIKNAKIYDEKNNSKITDVFIDFGEIIEIGNNIDDYVTDTIDAKGKTLFPGLIDVNCKICDPGFEYKEDILSVSRSAVKGGFTSITASPDTNPVIDDKTVVKYIENKSKQCSLVNIFQYGSMTKKLEGKELAEIGEMKKAGISALSDGGKSIADSNLMNNVLIYSTMFDLPVITSCEDRKIAGDGVMNKGEVSTTVGLRGIPREAEEIEVSRNIILSKYSGAILHISNISTRGSVEIIRRAKRDGIRVTCDTSPHYFSLTENELINYNTLAKVKPPLRTDEDVNGIIEGLLDGTIDMIGSGHSPTTIEQKRTEFDKAAFGISSLETAFLVSYNKLVLENKMPINLFIEKFSFNPAKLLKLQGKGLLKEGYDADLFLFDEEKVSSIDCSDFASKAKFSPFDKISLNGKILFTVVSGNIMYLQNF